MANPKKEKIPLWREIPLSQFPRNASKDKNNGFVPETDTGG